MSSAKEEREIGAHARSARYRELGEVALVDALKREDPLAFVEFVSRYQALVFRCSRELGVPAWERVEWVSDLLHDMVLALVKPGAIIPGSLGAYLIKACRNKAYAAHRASVRRTRHEDEAAQSYALESEQSVGLQGSNAITGSESDGDPLSLALRRLALVFEELLSPEERQMLDWSREYVPLRTIAAWLGVNRAAAAQRLWRLRHRLREAAPRIIATLTPEEQLELKRFFRRFATAQDVGKADIEFESKNAQVDQDSVHDQGSIRRKAEESNEE